MRGRSRATGSLLRPVQDRRDRGQGGDGLPRRDRPGLRGRDRGPEGIKDRVMRFIDEYRDAGKARALAASIASLCGPGRSYKFMEVCGGHTHTIYKHGLEDYLPETVTLVHGPGCPVCVIPMGRIDDAMAIAEQPDVILTTFGDMMRVPGGRGSFLDARARGADIRMVYSPLDALRIARQNPDRQVVFYAIGFETTAPSTALTVRRAAEEGIENFSVFCSHVTIIPAIKAIL